jgi:UrcA family protein
MLFAGAVFAAPAGSAPQLEQLLPEVLVEAGPVTRTVVGRSATTNAPIESVTVDYHVSYADLDLVKHADVQVLQERVEAAARDACQQLDELFPLRKSHQQTHACVEDAIRATTPQIQQVVASVQESDESFR